MQNVTPGFVAHNPLAPVHVAYQTRRSTLCVVEEPLSWTGGMVQRPALFKAYQVV